MSLVNLPHYPQLQITAFRYPIIDNHAHNILKAEHSSIFALEGLASEADGKALEDSKTSLALYRAVHQLSKLFNCQPTLDAIKAARSSMSYEDLCQRCLKPTGIACLLLDDLLNNVTELCYEYKWHDRLVQSRTKRIVRVEVLAEDLMKSLYKYGKTDLHIFEREFSSLLIMYCQDEEVVGFKSVVCYRTGLDIQNPSPQEVEDGFKNVLKSLESTDNIRLAHKPVNDFIVRITLSLAGKHNKPVQFHTGLGDNDITLATSNPAVMQPIIKEFPETSIVLLHSSYPFSQEAGYLTSVYKNVYLDFGEVFPMVSYDGQLSIIRQILEITPTNKLLWSTDGHWWPESYYLAAIQVREALCEVMTHSVAKGHITESQAVQIVKNIFYHNANRLYNLKLPSDPSLMDVALTPDQYISISTKHGSHLLEGLTACGTKFIRLHWVDYNNVIHYRVLSFKHVQKMLSRRSLIAHAGIGITKACLGLVNAVPAPGLSAIGGYFLSIDLDTLMPPSYASEHGFAMGTLQENDFVDGNDENELRCVDTCPRTLLKRIVQDAKTQNGLEFLVGFEVEFVLLNAETYKPVNTYGWSISSGIPGGSIISKVLNEISQHLETCGISLEQFHCESADGQYEVVTGPLPPLQAVDALIVTREIISNVAEKYGLRATLTPKPFATQCGTAAHAHISITSSKPTGPSGKGPITQIEASFLQSILDHLPAICAFSLASPASYWRVSDNTWSGGTWVCWGRENRETPVRLCRMADQSWNFEIKTLDGTSNPYLALSALLYCGILGVKKGVELQIGDVQSVPTNMEHDERMRLGIVKRIPSSHEEAVDNLKEDKDLIAGLGEQLVELYISVTELRRRFVNSLSEEEHKLWMMKHY